MEKILPSSHRRALNVKIVGLRFLGFWDPASSTSSCTRLFYTINHILAIFFYLLYLATLIGDTIINIRKKSAALESILYLSSALMIGIKIHKFATEHFRIARLTESILKPLDNLGRSKDPNIKQIMRTNVLHESILDISFGSLLIIFDIGILMMAFLNPTDLPVRGAFPFDTTTSPNHEYAIILQAIMVNVGLTMIVLTDEFIFSLIRWITVHLNILTRNYQKCNISDESTIQAKKLTYENVDNFLMKLQACSKKHRHLIDLMSEWNSIFNTVMFSEISTSCFMICLTSVQLVMIYMFVTSLFTIVIKY